ncbi:MAG TPA: bifunctional hydroxymethylpyrimidine kinase/phosphomethylpyrimidine kinase [Candidatus Dormibacteraeota bacterium]|nr:bifunctional hydroxymethylpyrimidine kinase/phosphomethylpyrimidine kinase [Candidatus Dormibacteraeota bacterium]
MSQALGPAGLPVACTVAGSDSGGGAGIQADLKTFAACGVYGASVVVALTAQNTVGVRRVESASLEMVGDQLDAVEEDLRPAAWKTGMLASAQIVELVADRLLRLRARHLVVDPVMIAKSGHALLPADAVEAVKYDLLPLAEVVTPNLPEARALTGMEVRDPAEARAAAGALAELGPRWVVLKGGHAEGPVVVDLVLDAARGAVFELEYPRLPGSSTHGTGCTLSAAIAAFLARGVPTPDAIASARAYLQEALMRAPGLGAGHGPLGHLDPEGFAPVIAAPPSTENRTTA